MSKDWRNEGRHDWPTVNKDDIPELVRLKKPEPIKPNIFQYVIGTIIFGAAIFLFFGMVFEALEHEAIEQEKKAKAFYEQCPHCLETVKEFTK